MEDVQGTFCWRYHHEWYCVRENAVVSVFSSTESTENDWRCTSLLHSIVPEVIAAIGDGASGMHAGSRAFKTCPVSGTGQVSDIGALEHTTPFSFSTASHLALSGHSTVMPVCLKSCTGSVSRLQPSAAVSELLPAARLSQHPGPCDPTVPVHDLTLSFPALLSRGMIQSVNSGTRSPVWMLFDLWEQVRLLWPPLQRRCASAHTEVSGHLGWVILVVLWRHILCAVTIIASVLS